MFSADRAANMRGIERVVAAILLTGAVVGAAAFAFMTGRTPNLGPDLGIPKAGAPSIVQAAPLPGLGAVLGVEPQAGPARPAGPFGTLLPARIERLAPAPAPAHHRSKPATTAPSTPPARRSPAPVTPAPTPSPTPTPTPAPATPATPSTPIVSPVTPTPPTQKPVTPTVPVTPTPPSSTPVTPEPPVAPTPPAAPIVIQPGKTIIPAPPVTVTAPLVTSRGPVLPQPAPPIAVAPSQPSVSTELDSSGGGANGGSND